MITVILLNEINFTRVPSAEKFQTWVNTVTKIIPEKIPENCREIGISIIDTETSAHLNKTYRGKKNPHQCAIISLRSDTWRSTRITWRFSDLCRSRRK